MFKPVTENKREPEVKILQIKSLESFDLVFDIAGNAEKVLQVG